MEVLGPPGQESNLSCIWDLCHSCGYTRALTHYSGLGNQIGNATETSQTIKPLATMGTPKQSSFSCKVLVCGGPAVRGGPWTVELSILRLLCPPAWFPRSLCCFALREMRKGGCTSWILGPRPSFLLMFCWSGLSHTTTSNCKGGWDVDVSPGPCKKRKQVPPTPDLLLIEKTNISIFLSKAIYSLCRKITTQI